MPETATQLRSATAAIVSAAFAFALANVLVKLVVAHIHPAEAYFFRNVAALAVFVFVSVGHRPVPVLPKKWLPLIVRSALVTASLICLFQSFKGLSIATAMALHLAAIPAASAINAFSNRGVWRSSAGIVGLAFAGFTGVVLVIQPTAMAAPDAVAFALLSAALACISLLMLRRLSVQETAGTVTFYLCAVGALIVAPVLPLVWTAPRPIDLGIFLVIGVLTWVAQLLTTRAIALSSNTYIAPFQYLVVVFGLGFDAAVWGVPVSAPELLGVGVVAACALGCYFAVRRIAAASTSLKLKGKPDVA